MARPEEKAQNMMNKWVRMAQGEQGLGHREKRRPYLAHMCDRLYDAEKFRRDIIREITEGIKKIQNPGMGEHAIRDLNDNINKLFREKWQWNKRIIELGGEDYNKLELRQRREEGDIYMATEEDDLLGESVRGSGGYRYFGAAKDLPGVKELFVRHAMKAAKRKRGDLYKNITPDYFGLRDEDDGVLLEIEATESNRLKIELENERKQYKQKIISKPEDETVEDLLSWNHLSDDDNENDDILLQIGGITGEADAIAAHFAVPTQEIVQQTLLEKKKRELMAQLGM